MWLIFYRLPLASIFFPDIAVYLPPPFFREIFQIAEEYFTKNKIYTHKNNF